MHSLFTTLLTYPIPNCPIFRAHNFFPPVIAQLTPIIDALHNSEKDLISFSSFTCSFHRSCSESVYLKYSQLSADISLWDSRPSVRYYHGKESCPILVRTELIEKVISIRGNASFLKWTYDNVSCALINNIVICSFKNGH